MEPIKPGQVRLTRYQGRELVVRVIMESRKSPGYWVVDVPAENRNETLPAWAFDVLDDDELRDTE
jgi:hypothetical protein